jgi:hypothetical protein
VLPYLAAVVQWVEPTHACIHKPLLSPFDERWWFGAFHLLLTCVQKKRENLRSSQSPLTANKAIYYIVWQTLFLSKSFIYILNFLFVSKLVRFQIVNVVVLLCTYSHAEMNHHHERTRCGEIDANDKSYGVKSPVGFLCGVPLPPLP